MNTLPTKRAPRRPPERDYSHRAVLDKLGIMPGHAVAVDERSGPLDAAMKQQLSEQTGRGLAEPDESADVVLAVVDASLDRTSSEDNEHKQANRRGCLSAECVQVQLRV